MNTNNDIIDTKTLELEFGINQKTAYSLARTRRIPHIRFGKRFLRFRRSEIAKWIEQHQVEVTKKSIVLGGNDEL